MLSAVTTTGWKPCGETRYYNLMFLFLFVYYTAGLTVWSNYYMASGAKRPQRCPMLTEFGWLIISVAAQQSWSPSNLTVLEASDRQTTLLLSFGGSAREINIVTSKSQLWNAAFKCIFLFKKKKKKTAKNQPAQWEAPLPCSWWGLSPQKMCTIPKKSLKTIQPALVIQTESNHWG